MSILDVDGVYQSADAVVAEQPVRHAGVNTFMYAASRFLRAVGEAEGSELWRQPCADIRRARWLLGTVPLPLDSGKLGLRKTAAALVDRARVLGRVVDASLLQQFAAVTDALQRLGGERDTPLALGVAAYLAASGTERAMVVVTGRGYQDDIVDVFTALRCPVEVGTARDLTGSWVYDDVVVVGPVGWLPPGVLNAPRAPRIGLVHYDFYREPQEVWPLFGEGPVLRGPMPSRISRRPPLVLGGASSRGSRLPEAQEAPELTGFDVLSLAGDAVAGLPADVLREAAPGEHERVAAEAAQLADGSFVLLPLEAGVHKVLLVEEDDEGSPAVEAVDAATVTVGDAVVLRGGSYYQSLVERADAALGDDAIMLRAIQSGWKAQLHDRVASHRDGAQGVAADLKTQGATTANLGYWTGPWCIRTRRKADFTVVMHYLGRSDEANHAWDALGRIDHAHRSAGRSYANAVQRAVSGDTWETLQSEQWCDIALDDTEAGARVALIDALLPRRLSVPAHYLCRLRSSEVS
ncbi:hypothetical protein [Streptomyces sp. NBC_01643]|uniref:hypothetical protein n=1 Tax=Streptomyces sp. NBC_01643 TaxID=2975906 RepID=UPI00386D24D1|nr:hypothetical protein OHB03_16370 [Streptomyces sp. NBC_01643]